MKHTLTQPLSALGAALNNQRRRLDKMPWPWLLAAGVLLGMVLGAWALLGVGGWRGQVLCLVALGLAVAAGWNARPVLVGAPVPPVVEKPKPKPPKIEPVKVTPPEIKPEPDWPPREPRIVEDIPGLLDMVELPGGTFQMGSPDTDDQAWDSEKPQHTVTVSAFAVARYPVTRKLYREILGRGPDEWRSDRGDDQLPANYVSWFNAVEFCNALSQRQRLRTCYRIDGQQVEWDREANGYRLPTEAEWEYAARAGTTTRWFFARWFFGISDFDLGRYAWFSGNSGNRVHPVGEKAPNPWGLRDIIGNVWEWCWDWYGGYSATPGSDPTGPPTGAWRVRRGGVAWDLRSARRNSSRPEFRDDFFGFRCVRGPRRQPL